MTGDDGDAAPDAQAPQDSSDFDALVCSTVS